MEGDRRAERAPRCRIVDSRAGAARVHRDLADLRPARPLLHAIEFRRRLRERQGRQLYSRGGPEGETAQAWTQMITVTGAKGLAGNRQVTPESFAVSIAAGFKKACPDTFDVTPFGATRFGDRDGFVAVAGCGRVASSPDKHSETVLIIAVRG